MPNFAKHMSDDVSIHSVIASIIDSTVSSDVKSLYEPESDELKNKVQSVNAVIENIIKNSYPQFSKNEFSLFKKKFKEDEEIVLDDDDDEEEKLDDVELDDTEFNNAEGEPTDEFIADTTTDEDDIDLEEEEPVDTDVVSTEPESDLSNAEAGSTIVQIEVPEGLDVGNLTINLGDGTATLDDTEDTENVYSIPEPDTDDIDDSDIIMDEDPVGEEPVELDIDNFNTPEDVKDTVEPISINISSGEDTADDELTNDMDNAEDTESIDDVDDEDLDAINMDDEEDTLDVEDEDEKDTDDEDIDDLMESVNRFEKSVSDQLFNEVDSLVDKHVNRCVSENSNVVKTINSLLESLNDTSAAKRKVNKIRKKKQGKPTYMVHKDSTLNSESVAILPVANNVDWNSIKAFKRIGEAATSGASLNTELMKRAYLVCEGSGSTEDDYKYLIADIVDGKLYAIPKAIESVSHIFNQPAFISSMNDTMLKQARCKLDVYREACGLNRMKWLNKGERVFTDGVGHTFMSEVDSSARDYAYNSLREMYEKKNK